MKNIFFVALLLLFSTGVFAQSKAGASLKEMKKGKTTERTLPVVVGDSVTLEVTVEFPQSWKNMIPSSGSPCGNGEASMAVIATTDKAKSHFYEMFSHDAKDLNYFQGSIIGDVVNVDKYYVQDSMKVVRIDARRDNLGIYSLMYYMESKSGYLVTASCVLPDATNVSSRMAMEKYVPVFDAIMGTVKIKETISAPIQKDTMYVRLNEYVARIKTDKGESKMSKKNVAVNMYADSTINAYFMMDARNISSVVDSAATHIEVAARLMATIAEIQKMDIKSMTMTKFTTKDGHDIFFGEGSQVEKNETKLYVLACIPYKEVLLCMRSDIKIESDKTYHVNNIINTLKNMDVFVHVAPVSSAPTVNTIRIHIDKDTTRALYISKKDGWKETQDAKSKNIFIYMTRGESMGILASAYGSVDYTNPSHREARCKELTQRMKASSVRYVRLNEYDVFEIFDSKENDLLTQRKDMHSFLIYGKGIRVNIWYFCPIGTSVETVSETVREIVKNWEIK